MANSETGRRVLSGAPIPLQKALLQHLAGYSTKLINFIHFIVETRLKPGYTLIDVTQGGMPERYTLGCITVVYASLRVFLRVYNSGICLPEGLRREVYQGGVCLPEGLRKRVYHGGYASLRVLERGLTMVGMPP